jgi:peptidoglycan/xylan/chitin deacetylase (PgdA/CDA1 family)
MLAWISLIFLSFHTWAKSCDDTGPGMRAQILRSLKGLECRGRSIHLTFDDGPVPDVTGPLLSELKRLNVAATFFISTTRLASSNSAAANNRHTLQWMLRDGHVVANHGHEHESYDLRMDSQGTLLSRGLTVSQRAEQLRLSEQLLNQATNGAFARQAHRLFRFPYGRGVLPSDRELDEMERMGMSFSDQDRATRLKEYRRQSESLIDLADRRYTHLLWNHDSGDSRINKQNLSATEMTHFITENVKGYCARGSPQEQISLFHDTKKFVAEAIPQIVEITRCLGGEFVSADKILRSTALKERETIITPDMVARAPVDALADLIQSLNLNCDTCHTSPSPSEGSCLSQYDGKIYPHCSGGKVSICYRGKWYARAGGDKEALCAGEGL